MTMREEEPEPWTSDAHLPSDARRMGLNSSVPDGALLELAGALNGTKRSHRMVAWVLLAVFAAPIVLSLISLAR